MKYTITSIKNWNKYIETGEEKYLNDINLWDLKEDDRFMLASEEGGEKEVVVC